MKEKIIVLAPCVALNDPHCLSKFAEHDVVVPVATLSVIGNFNGDHMLSLPANVFTNQLDELDQHSVNHKIMTAGGGQITFDTNGDRWTLPETVKKSPANSLIITCQRLAKENPEKAVILVTTDPILRIMAQAFGVKAEDYRAGKIGTDHNVYTGTAQLTISPGGIQRIHRAKSLSLKESGLNDEVVSSMYPNTFCHLFDQGTQTTALATFRSKDVGFHLIPKYRPKEGEVGPKNDQQTFALHACLNKDITLVTLAGRPGSGKTLMALLAGFKMLKDGSVNKIIVFRPTTEAGDPIGFLPGTIDEKMAPWRLAITDNLELIAGGKDGPSHGKREIVKMIEDNRIEIVPVTHCRGRTFNDSIIIVDEAQNLIPIVGKTVVTRAGQNCKIIVTGDLRQIDNRFLDARSNSLAHIIARMVGQRFYAHLQLSASVRSQLAEIADDLL